MESPAVHSPELPSPRPSHGQHATWLARHPLLWGPAWRCASGGLAALSKQRGPQSPLDSFTTYDSKLRDKACWAQMSAVTSLLGFLMSAPTGRRKHGVTDQKLTHIRTEEDKDRGNGPTGQEWPEVWTPQPPAHLHTHCLCRGWGETHGSPTHTGIAWGQANTRAAA